ncbi:hypothetical protein CS063_15045 [Sporanaerobium hydrogeniformans]|uniref:Uncharacterized protein n=1 Tax=Sporanaerobium hydrogeniformans TaxID=3072179 RepID=A0AC61D9P5_9FIRM|nr:hypothetical protein [Sporanaerobium hydrogeniformans]PHV69560.1 hypothetical protein CS063_15045 [Sporanaerobium hydrogeniformans]
MARPNENTIRFSELFLLEQDAKDTMLIILKKEDLSIDDAKVLQKQVALLEKLTIKKRCGFIR